MILFVMRMITSANSSQVPCNQLLRYAGYLYGFNAMCLALRIFGVVMEITRDMGVIQIALFRVLSVLTTIFFQFCAVILAFSLMLTKIYVTDRSYQGETTESGER